MKKNIYFLIIAMTLPLVNINCKGPDKKTTSKSTKQEIFACMDSTTMIRDGIKLTWIKDNAQKRIMPLDLFGDIPRQLVDSLGISDGILSSISTFLLEIDGKRILFDAGMGAPDSRLIAGLKACGISPEEIDYLYLTHFHGDHIGGMMQGDSVVFPKAEVYASRQEYEGWMQMSEEQKKQVVHTMEAYKERLHLFEYNDTLPCGVIAMNGEGHTPGHTIYKSGKFLIVGDLIHGAALQLAFPDICASYDMNPQEAICTRKYYLAYAKEKGLLMAGMHQPESKQK